MSQRVIKQTDQGKTFTVHPGDQFTIELAEIPSTGYQWTVAAGYDQIIILQTSHHDSASGMGVGGSGTATFTFQAKAVGKTQLRLMLKRAWETDDKAIERFAVTIDAQ